MIFYFITIRIQINEMIINAVFQFTGLTSLVLILNQGRSWLSLNINNVLSTTTHKMPFSFSFVFENAVTLLSNFLTSDFDW